MLIETLGEALGEKLGFGGDWNDSHAVVDATQGEPRSPAAEVKAEEADCSRSAIAPMEPATTRARIRPYSTTVTPVSAARQRRERDSARATRPPRPVTFRVYVGKRELNGRQQPANKDLTGHFLGGQGRAQVRGQAGVSSAAHSTWWVMGKASNACSPPSS